MCLGIPMKLVEIDGDTGIVESGGLRKSAKLSFVKGVKKGDYLLIHAGFAMERVKPKEAAKTLRALKEAGID